MLKSLGFLRLASDLPEFGYCHFCPYPISCKANGIPGVIHKRPKQPADALAQTLFIKNPMNTTQTAIPYSKLDKDFVEAFEQYENWHLRLWDELKDFTSDKGETELPLLDSIFKEKQAFVLQQIEKIATLRQSLSSWEDEQHKLFCEQSALMPLLCKTPYYAQCIKKPRGYAGDAEMMDMIYRDAFEGDSLFAKVIHRIGTQADTGHAIRNRKILVKREIQAIKPGKVLSLAAGPAREIRELIQNPNSDHHQFLALDHDIHTLRQFGAHIHHPNFSYGIANAFHFIKGKNTILIPRKSALNRCNPKRDKQGLNALSLPLKYKIRSLEPESFDMVYSIGLYDYIQTFPALDKGTKALTKYLFDLLKPGGTLLLGNVTPNLPAGIRWVMEHVCDWYLIYREAPQLLEFLEAIPSKQLGSVEILQEDLGINAFLKVNKR